MKWPWRRPRPERDRPNPAKAEAELARLREQRHKVERLRNVLRSDREQNHYGMNVERLFRGGKP